MVVQFKSFRNLLKSTGVFPNNHLQGLSRIISETNYPLSSSCLGENVLLMIEADHHTAYRL